MDIAYPRIVEYTSSVDGFRDRYLFHDAGKKTDCLVYLHGHGSDGSQLFTREDIKVNLPLIGEFGLSVISPDLRGNGWMCPAAVDDLAEILSFCREKHHFRRFVFMGGSMGGTGALIFAMRRPELVDALGVMGGVSKLRRYRESLRRHCLLPIHREILDAIEAHYRESDYDLHDVSAQAERIDMPLFFAHGTADGIMPVQEMYDLRDRLDGRPGKGFRTVPRGGHDSPLPLFGEILKTLIEQIN